jgi:hypothetical protein
VKIRTSYWVKPIAVRGFDWSAIDDSTYDGPGCPVGYGTTEAEAIKDLRTQIAERDDKLQCEECGAIIEEGELCDDCAVEDAAIEARVQAALEQNL